MEMTEWLFAMAGWFALGLVVALSPGPDTFLILRTVGTHGPRAGLRCISGISTGLLFHTAATLLIVFPCQRGAPQLLAALQLAGAAFLGYLGVACLRLRPTFLPADGPPGPGRKSAAPGFYRQGLWTNLLNPQVLVLYLSLVTQLLPAGGGMDRAAGLLVSVSLAILLWYVVLSQLAGRWGGRLSPSRQVVLNRGAGLLFLGYAGYGFWSAL